MKNDQLFCVGQKAFINKNGKILVLNDPIMGLDLPGGKIQEKELDFKKSLKREVKEETNLEIEVSDPFITWYYEVPKNIKHRNSGKKVYLVGYKCKYVSGEIKLSDEHNNLMWIDKNSYKNLDKKWVAYFAVKKYFSEE